MRRYVAFVLLFLLCGCSSYTAFSPSSDRSAAQAPAFQQASVFTQEADTRSLPSPTISLIPSSTAALSATPTSSSSPTPEITISPTPSVFIQPVAWQKVAQLLAPANPTALYDGRYLVWIEPYFKRPGDQFWEGVNVFVRHGNVVSTLVKTDGGRIVGLDSVFNRLSSGFLAFYESEPSGPQVRLWLFNLQTGERKVIDAREGKFDVPALHAPSRLAMDTGQLVWTSLLSDQHSCLRMYDWKARDTHNLFCTDQAGEILVPYFLRGSTLTYGVVNFAGRGVKVWQRDIGGTGGDLSEPRLLLDPPSGVDFLIGDGQILAWLGEYEQGAMARKLYATGPEGVPQFLGYSSNNIE